MSSEVGQPIELLESGLWDAEEFIQQGLNEYARSTVGRDCGMKHFAFVIRDQGRYQAALVGAFLWDELRILSLFVAPESRRKGLGSELIKRALEYGKQGGCRFASVETLHFQAPEFYPKLGFFLEFVRKGYPEACGDRYYFRFNF